MKKIRMLLKSIFEEAVNDDLIAKNPMRRLPLPNTADPDKPVLEKADAAKALMAMESNKSTTGIRNLQPVGKRLGIRTPLTFQVLRRSFATHNQKQLKDVQAHLGHESTGTTADLYVVEIPDEVRRTQERYAAEIDALRAPNKPMKAERKPPGRKRSTAQLDATGRKLWSRMATSY